MALQQIRYVNEDERIDDCIDNCLEATQAAEWCATECIRMGDEDMVECIELCRDAADLTALHARLMVRDSDYSAGLAETCADLCDACADECETHDEDHCQVCAEVLRECADSCRDMAGA